MVHGEDAVCESFVECLKTEHRQNACAPYSGSIFDLRSGRFAFEAQPVQAVKKAQAPNTVYARLLAAGSRLMALIRKSEHGANKDLAKLADQINALCDKAES